jgi:DNA-directed RNA polymerase subunit RPC12/RpoP
MAYRCSKCGYSSTSPTKPLAGTCPKGGGHSWSVSGTTTVRWRCNKCGNSTMGPNRPLPSPCNRGGNHTWQKQ